MSQINAVDFLKKGGLFIHCNYPSTPHVYEITKVHKKGIWVTWRSNTQRPINYSLVDATRMLMEGLWIPIDDRTKYDI